MAYPSYTYTLTNSTTADATQVMQNFNDLLNGVSDGTKDISVNALTVAGAATLNGNITLGNATSDDLTATGRWASNLDPKTAATYDHGTSSQTWRAMYLDNGATDSGAIYFDAGTTKFIKGSADGTTLNIGGFTKIAPVDAEYKGRTTSAAATAGYIGEVIETVSTITALTGQTTGVWINVPSLTITLTAGIWCISGRGTISINTSVGVSDCKTVISAASGNTTTDHYQEGNIGESAAVPTSALNAICRITSFVVRCDGTNTVTNGVSIASTTLYLKARANGLSSGIQSARGRITAVRIA